MHIFICLSPDRTSTHKAWGEKEESEYFTVKHS